MPGSMLVGADGIGWENQGISRVSLNQPKMKNRLQLECTPTSHGLEKQFSQWKQNKPTTVAIWGIFWTNPII